MTKKKDVPERPVVVVSPLPPLGPGEALVSAEELKPGDVLCLTRGTVERIALASIGLTERVDVYLTYDRDVRTMLTLKRGAFVRVVRPDANKGVLVVEAELAPPESELPSAAGSEPILQKGEI